jgi:hypothetical protein
MGAVISTLRGIFFFWRGNESRQETSPLHDDSADQRSAAPEKAQNVVEGAVAKFSELKDGEYVHQCPFDMARCQKSKMQKAKEAGR